jgi:hypothetical protein
LTLFIHHLFSSSSFRADELTGGATGDAATSVLCDSLGKALTKTWAGDNEDS